MKMTRKWIITSGIIAAGCVLITIIYWRFVNHESWALLAVSGVVGMIYFLVSLSSDFRVGRLSYVGGVVVCSVVIFFAVLLYFESTTFLTKARYRMKEYAESHTLQEPMPTGNKIDIGDSRAFYYMFFTTKEGEPRMLLVRETEEDLGAVEEIPILLP